MDNTCFRLRILHQKNIKPTTQTQKTTVKWPYPFPYTYTLMASAAKMETREGRKVYLFSKFTKAEEDVVVLNLKNKTI